VKSAAFFYNDKRFNLIDIQSNILFAGTNNNKKAIREVI
jgi:hypothetical protein